VCGEKCSGRRVRKKDEVHTKFWCGDNSESDHLQGQERDVRTENSVEWRQEFGITAERFHADQHVEGNMLYKCL
jgi:hypothetical protein